jgi:hypothetical protein
MNRLISESDLPDHNTASNIHDVYQMNDMCNEYFEKIKFRDPGEFNTVRLNEPKIRYKNETNASATNIKATKR